MEPKSLSPDAFARVKICQNVFATGAPPLGELKALHLRPLAGFGGSEGNGRAGKRKKEERRWRGGDGWGKEGLLRLRIPGSLFFTPVRPCKLV